MTYKDIIQKAKKDGVASEQVMWTGIKRVDEILDIIKDDYVDVYWDFMRDTHTDLYGCHYNEVFATYDVDSLCYTDKDGKKHEGAHWSHQEIEDATRSTAFPDSATEWDKYVAYNVMYADLCKGFSDQEIMKSVYLFFFADEDAPSGKIWRYVNAMRK